MSEAAPSLPNDALRRSLWFETPWGDEDEDPPHRRDDDDDDDEDNPGQDDDDEDDEEPLRALVHKKR